MCAKSEGGACRFVQMKTQNPPSPGLNTEQSLNINVWKASDKHAKPQLVHNLLFTIKTLCNMVHVFCVQSWLCFPIVEYQSVQLPCSYNVCLCFSKVKDANFVEILILQFHEVMIKLTFLVWNSQMFKYHDLQGGYPDLRNFARSAILDDDVITKFA